MHTLNLRSFLWFVTGVALTVTSVATFGAWRADAGGPPVGESTFVPVAPCRLFDTRPGEAVPGSNTTPIGVAETRTQQVTGNVGNCSIPSGISGVAMNVTILNPTGAADSFLTLFPANETTLPVVSNLNWSPGQGATPNKVDVKVSPDGKVKIYNNVGTIDVIGDIVGYYTSSTVTQLSTDVANLQVAVAQLTAAGATQDAAILELGAGTRSLLEDTNVIPSGVTVTGLEIFSGTASPPVPFVGSTFDLPGIATEIELAFGAGPAPFGTADAECTGSDNAPTAAPGFLCIYPDEVENVASANIRFTSNESVDRVSVLLAPPTLGQGSGLVFTWAYTAP